MRISLLRLLGSPESTFISTFQPITFTEKYPQIKKLFGVDPLFKWKVVFLVFVQCCMLSVMANQSWPIVILTAYLFGGVINHALMLAVHEIAHSAGFGVEKPLANRCLGIFANLPIGIPFAVAFKGYHLEHHRVREPSQGIKHMD